MRRLHLFVRNNDDANLMALFEFDDGGALFVQQERSNVDRNLSMNLICIVLQRLFFD